MTPGSLRVTNEFVSAVSKCIVFKTFIVSFSGCFIKGKFLRPSNERQSLINDLHFLFSARRYFNENPSKKYFPAPDYDKTLDFR